MTLNGHYALYYITCLSFGAHHRNLNAIYVTPEVNGISPGFRVPKIIKLASFWPSYSRNNRVVFSGTHCIGPPHLFMWPPLVHSWRRCCSCRGSNLLLGRLTLLSPKSDRVQFLSTCCQNGARIVQHVAFDMLQVWTGLKTAVSA